MPTMKLSKVLGLHQLFESLCGSFPVPVNGVVPKDGILQSPLDFSAKVAWNIGKNLKVLRAERESVNEQVNALRKKSLQQVFGDKYPNALPKEIPVDEQEKAAEVGRLFQEGAAELDKVEVEIKILRLPYEGLKLDKNTHFPRGLLPNLMDYIDGEPSDIAEPKEAVKP